MYDLILDVFLYWKLFSAEILKNFRKCHFWANVMLRQSRLRASRASPAQKSRGLRVVAEMILKSF